MADIQWEIKGPSFGTCNCDWGCPCQFNRPPTHGHCRGMNGMLIEQGHYGDVPLDGLLWAFCYAWPGAIDKGNGTGLGIIDERANEDQRTALTEIVYGRASKDGADVLSIFASTMSTLLDPIFAPIEFECDIEKRQGRVTIPGILEAKGEPMRDPFSGDEQRARLVLPDGFEFTEVECGSGTTKATGGIDLDYEDTWAQFCIYHFNQDGIVR